LADLSAFWLDGGYYSIDRFTSNGYSSTTTQFLFSDNTCTTPNAFLFQQGSEARLQLIKSGVSSWWKPTGSYGLTQGGDVFYKWDGAACTTRTIASAPASDVLRGVTTTMLTALGSGAPPSYVAPVTIRER
jgi:hypothetical protein